MFVLAISQPINGLVFVADGVLQGAKAFKAQAVSMAVATVPQVLYQRWLQGVAQVRASCYLNVHWRSQGHLKHVTVKLTGSLLLSDMAQLTAASSPVEEAVVRSCWDDAADRVMGGAPDAA